MDGRGILVRFPAEAKDLLVSKLSRSTLKLTQTFIQWIMAHTLEVRRVTEHLGIKNHWSYTATTPRTYAACTKKTLLCLVRIRKTN